jgi:peptidoglycan/LPS O-acetylase OafA/YrhL
MMMVENTTYFYSLIHNPLQMIIIRFLPKINFVIALGVVLILSFAVGYLYYYIFEKKGITFVKLN